MEVLCRECETERFFLSLKKILLPGLVVIKFMSPQCKKKHIPCHEAESHFSNYCTENETCLVGALIL